MTTLADVAAEQAHNHPGVTGRPMRELPPFDWDRALVLHTLAAEVTVALATVRGPHRAEIHAVPALYATLAALAAEAATWADNLAPFVQLVTQDPTRPLGV